MVVSVPTVLLLVTWQGLLQVTALILLSQPAACKGVFKIVVALRAKKEGSKYFVLKEFKMVIDFMFAIESITHLGVSGLL